MGKFVTAVAAAGLTVGLGAAAAVPAWGSTSGGLGQRVHVINLHAAYEAHLGHTKRGKISGITYPRGKGPKLTAPKANASCSEPNCPLVYQGGPVQHSPHVWLLLWGPTWSSNSGEEASATYMENFYKGLGVQPNDSWSNTTDQYSDSTGHPSFSGSVYEGVSQDTSTPPSGVTQAQLAAEADAFASTHKITDLLDAQIIIATQSGTCPQGFYAPSCAGGTGSYCAWHSSSNEPYTNLPYQLDAGSGCGENFVNSGTAGTHDGFSIVGGHEYAETITDPNPDSGWIDFSDPSGGEIGDKCAWVTPSGDVTLSTGSFAMQSLWSNAAFKAMGAGCVMATTTTATKTAVTPSANPVAVGEQVTYTAAVTPVPNGGTVAFTDGVSTIPGCSSVAVSTTTGKASCQTTYKTTAGSPRSIKASYSGNAVYKSSQSSALPETVEPAVTATAVSSALNPTTVGQQVTYTATVTPAPDGGTVAFTDGGSTISGCSSVTVSTTTGNASCQTTYMTSVGSPRSVNASYSGDPNYKSSQSSEVAQSVAPVPSPSVGSAKSTGTGVRDTVTCNAPAGLSCQVTQTLASTEKLRRGKPVAVSAKKRKKTVVVGTKTVTIAAGQTMTITIKLNGAGRRLLKRFGKLPVIVSTGFVSNGQLVTVARGQVTIKPLKKHGKSRDVLGPVQLIWYS